jgi:hypothetical protein
MIGLGLVVRRPGEPEPIVRGGGREPPWVSCSAGFLVV